MKKHTLLAMSVLLAVPARATTYYVANAGSDSNTGMSPQLPWRTIERVNRFSFAPGDTILFKRGDVWREQLTVPLSGRAGNIVTFGAYGVGPKPIIKASDVVSGWAMERAPYVWKAAVAFRPNQVFRNGQRMRLVHSLRELAADNQWFFDAASTLYIYSNVMPSSATIEAGNRASCIRLGNKSYVTINSLDCRHANGASDGAVAIYASQQVSNITVSNTEVSLSYSFGMHFYPERGSLDTIILVNNTLDHCVVQSGGIHGLNFGLGTGVISNVTVTGGRYSYAGVHGDPNVAPQASHGINFNNVHTATVTNVEADHNGSSGINVENGTTKLTITGGSSHDNGGAADSNGIGIGSVGNGSSNVTISGVDLYNNVGAAIEVASTTLNQTFSNLTVKYCKIHGSTGLGNPQDGSGVHIGGAHAGILLFYNLIYQNRDSGLWLVQGPSGSPTVEAYGNVIWGNGNGTLPGMAGVWLNGGLINLIFKNNLVGQNNLLEVNKDTASAVFTSDHNDWFHASGGKFMKYSDGKTYSFSEWKTASGQDSHSMSADPLVQSDTNADFRPKENSPLIDRGTALGVPYHLGLDPRGVFQFATLDQRLFGTGYEIGAFVYVPYAPGSTSEELNSLQKKRTTVKRR